MSKEGAITKVMHAGKAVRTLRAYTLHGPKGMKKEIEVPLYRIGTHQSNDLVLADASVSRFHAEIEAGELGYRIRDLDSTNGTWINDIRISEAFLPTEAKLRMGASTLRFTLEDKQSVVDHADRTDYHGLIGRSAVMRELFAQLERVAPTTATVLIDGESGTGKERVAAALHAASGRKGGPFVVLDCAAIPASLVESQLFGHERGAFTGATQRYDGHFQQADRGTLFLDELGELPLELQPKLLRVLETKEIRRIGGTRAERVDVRVIAATNRDLAREVNQGTFREDLFYRLAVVRLRIPPLRDRSQDISLLVEHFIREACGEDTVRAERLIGSITPMHRQRLEQLPWRGNVRELRNFIDRTMALTAGTFDSTVLPQGEAADRAKATAGLQVDLSVPFALHKQRVIEQFERDYLSGQLARADHNLAAAARASGLDRMNFKRLLRKFR